MTRRAAFLPDGMSPNQQQAALFLQYYDDHGTKRRVSKTDCPLYKELYGGLEEEERPACRWPQHVSGEKLEMRSETPAQRARLRAQVQQALQGYNALEALRQRLGWWKEATLLQEDEEVVWGRVEGRRTLMVKRARGEEEEESGGEEEEEEESVGEEQGSGGEEEEQLEESSGSEEEEEVVRCL